MVKQAIGYTLWGIGGAVVAAPLLAIYAFLAIMIYLVFFGPHRNDIAQRPPVATSVASSEDDGYGIYEVCDRYGCSGS